MDNDIPTKNRLTCLSFADNQNPKNYALGGVATGSIKAQLAASVAPIIVQKDANPILKQPEAQNRQRDMKP